MSGRVARRRRTALTNVWILEGVDGLLCVGSPFDRGVLWGSVLCFCWWGSRAYIKFGGRIGIASFRIVSHRSRRTGDGKQATTNGHVKCAFGANTRGEDMLVPSEDARSGVRPFWAYACACEFISNWCGFGDMASVCCGRLERDSGRVHQFMWFSLT